ncbi:MAG: Gfo/Idh/MocA family oxidoreductase, partial [Proteobacteria bacterium]|nr:Gfo/Idh/MocA family oxidoreductase [Pseudomonadota bacterium]
MNKIKTALTGFGLSGKVFHAPFLDHSSKFDLCQILQRSAQDSKKIYPQVKVVRSLTEILNSPEIELVVINTPNRFHYSMTRDALQAGKHVIVEKPFAPSLKETEELISLAQENNLHLFVFHNRRWDGDFMTVQKLINSHVLGDLIEYEAHYDRFKPELNSKNWKETPDSGSGTLYDLGTHIIDQAVCLFGKPQAVSAELFVQRKESLVDDAFSLILEYSSLKVILKSSLLAEEEGPRYVLKGKKGSFTKYGIDPQEDDKIAGISLSSSEWGKEKQNSWGDINTSID